MLRQLTLVSLIAFVLYSCSKSGGSHSIPTLTTTAVTGITDTTAISGGDITSNGGGGITARGTMYDTSAAFATPIKISSGTGSGSFSTSIKVLYPNTNYYVRAFATNSVGTGYGNTVQFSTTFTPTAYTVSTYTGNGTNASTDGILTTASFFYPDAIASDPTGILYVTQPGSANPGATPSNLRKITPDGTVSTLTTIGNQPIDIVSDATGNLYVTESMQKIVYKVTPAGTVTTLAGGSTPGVDGQGAAAGFTQPSDLGIDKTGNLYITDGKKIRMVTSAGYVSTLPVTANKTFYGITVDAANNIYVTDSNVVERIDPSNNITVISNRFSYPIELRMDRSGNILVVDANANQIISLTPAGVQTTIAGSGAKGSKDGNGATATFYNPAGITVDPTGRIFVADQGNSKIRLITHN